MVEYDFMIALVDRRRRDDAERIKFPRSCVIYLRTTATMPDEETLEIEMPDGQVILYRVPILKLRDYTIDEIFEKNLLILLPYYIMNYEKELSKIAKNEEKSQVLLAEYRNIVKMLEERTKDDQTGLFYDMMQLMRRLVDYMLRKQCNLRERMCEEMGGKVLRLPSDELREERELGVEIGLKKGISQGISQGTAFGKEEKTRQVIANMLKRGMSEEDICALAECNPILIDEVRRQLK
jgi:ribosomal protein S15P/S13E